MLHSISCLEYAKSWKTTGLLLATCLLAQAPMGLSQSTSQPATAFNAVNSEENRAEGGASAGTASALTPHHSVKQLSEGLKNQDPAVRAAAVEMLGDARDPGAVKLLVGELHDQDPYVRAIADTMLIKIGSPAAQTLIVALGESDPYVPALAALALSTMKDPRAHEALMKVLNERNSRAIFGIHTYYVKLGVPGSEPALIEALDKYPSREMAEEFLNSGNPALQEAAKQWAVRFKRTLRTASSATTVRWASAEDAPETSATPTVGAQ